MCSSRMAGAMFLEVKRAVTWDFLAKMPIFDTCYYHSISVTNSITTIPPNVFSLEGYVQKYIRYLEQPWDWPHPTVCHTCCQNVIPVEI